MNVGWSGCSVYVCGARAGVRDAASFWLQGYGGNASPFPYNCSYPPGYSQFPPSLLRVERTPKLLIANVITQSGNNGGGGRWASCLDDLLIRLASIVFCEDGL